MSNPQIAFDNGDTWSIIGALWQRTGVRKHKDMPAVPDTCPVMDTSRIRPSVLQKILRDHISPDGVDHMFELYADLLMAGGYRVTR